MPKAETLAKIVALSQRPDKPVKDKKIGPTPEREAMGHFPSMGMAVKMQPAIETLALRWKREEKQGVPKEERTGISPEEFASLDYYREQAHKAMDDEAQQSVLAPERIMGGSRGTIISGPLPALLWETPAMFETGKIERDLGSLLDIARAIAVDDLSLTQWCIAKFGGREKTVEGNFVTMVPRGKNNGSFRIAMARMELRMAAHRIAR